MKYKNYTVYDDADFFKKYNEKRSLGQSPNELIEQPIIDELIGEVSEKKILDLGCGDGKYGLALLKQGAKFYQGIEGSEKMAGLAQENLSGYSAAVSRGDIEKKDFGKGEYELVISRLVLHYIEDLEPLMERIAASLKENGEFVFSIEHPVITSCYEAYHKKEKRGNWIVDNYFDTGERTNVWIGKEVIKYHKTLEDYWRIIKATNYEVMEMRESKPIVANFENKADFARRNRIPLFLMFKLRKK